MRVETSRFGVLDINPEALFTFPMGLLGFSRHKKFVVLDHREDSPFKWLQSAEDGDLAFIISDPLFFKPDYHINVRRGEISVIDPEDADDLVVSVIMTVPDDPHQLSANLMAPLVFNMVNRRGMQLVLHDQRYPVRYKVLPEGASPTEIPMHEPAIRSISIS
ncbi:MAG: flagellar assembly protein FliW [Bradymonadia bacterium]